MLNQPKDFWNMRSKDYDKTSGGIYAQAYDRTVEHAVKYLNPEQRVLDFACGTGLLTLRLAPKTGSIRGIDISPEMAAIAQGKLSSGQFPNVEVTNTDLFDPCLEPDSFDVVTAFNVMCYIPDLPRHLARIRELLRPDGLFLSVTDCLASRPSRAGMKKLFKSRTGAMPYVAFFTQRGLAKRIEQNGFTILERENLFAAPPNLFIAARRQ